MESISIVIFMGCAALTFTGFLSFAILSVREGEKRSARISILVCVLGSSFFVLLSRLPDQTRTIIVVLLAVLFSISSLLFLWPSKPTQHINGSRPDRFDERDVVFARKTVGAKGP